MKRCVDHVQTFLSNTRQAKRRKRCSESAQAAPIGHRPYCFMTAIPLQFDSQSSFMPDNCRQVHIPSPPC